MFTPLCLLLLPFILAANIEKKRQTRKPLEKSALEQLEGFQADPAYANIPELKTAIADLMTMDGPLEQNHQDAFDVLMKHGLSFDRFIKHVIAKDREILRFVYIFEYLIERIPLEHDRRSFVQYLLTNHYQILFHVHPKELGFGCIKKVPEYPSRGFWQLEMHKPADQPSVNLAFLLLSSEMPLLKIRNLSTPLNRAYDTLFLELILWSKYKHPEWRQIGMFEFKQLVADLHEDPEVTCEHYIRLFRCVLRLLDSEVNMGLPAYLEELKATDQLKLHQIILFCLDLNLDHLQSWPVAERQKFLADLFYEWVISEAKMHVGSHTMEPLYRLMDYTVPAYLNQLTDASPAINSPESMVHAILTPQGQELVRLMDLTTINWAYLLCDHPVKGIRIVQTIVSIVGEDKCLAAMPKAGVVRFILFPVLLKMMIGRYRTLEDALADENPLFVDFTEYHRDFVKYPIRAWDLLQQSDLIPLHRKSLLAMGVAAKRFLELDTQYSDGAIQLGVEMAQLTPQ